MRVAEGTTVTWESTSGTTRDVTVGVGWGSGDTFEIAFMRTLETSGTVNYTCSMHQALGATRAIIAQ